VHNAEYALTSHTSNLLQLVKPYHFHSHAFANDTFTNLSTSQSYTHRYVLSQFPFSTSPFVHDLAYTVENIIKYSKV